MYNDNGMTGTKPASVKAINIKKARLHKHCVHWGAKGKCLLKKCAGKEHWIWNGVYEVLAPGKVSA